MALHRKWDALTGLNPDIAIISEAAAPDVLERKGLDLSEISHFWLPKVGGGANKGLLVLAFNAWQLKPLPCDKPQLDIFLPLEAFSDHAHFNLLAAWSFNHRGSNSKHPLHDAIERYRNFLTNGLLVGDLNNSTVWDQKSKHKSFIAALTRLDQLGLQSTYHARNNEPFGHETQATIYWRDRTEDGPRYHIDYMFTPKAWAQKCKTFELGTYADWIGSGLSDHVPLISEWDLGA